MCRFYEHGAIIQTLLNQVAAIATSIQSDIAYNDGEKVAEMLPPGLMHRDSVSRLVQSLADSARPDINAAPSATAPNAAQKQHQPEAGPSTTRDAEGSDEEDGVQAVPSSKSSEKSTSNSEDESESPPPPKKRKAGRRRGSSKDGSESPPPSKKKEAGRKGGPNKGNKSDKYRKEPKSSKKTKTSRA